MNNEHGEPGEPGGSSGPAGFLPDEPPPDAPLVRGFLREEHPLRQPLKPPPAAYQPPFGGWRGWTADNWPHECRTTDGPVPWQPSWGCPTPHPPPVDCADPLPSIMAGLGAVLRAALDDLRRVEAAPDRWQVNMRLGQDHQPSGYPGEPPQVNLAGAVLAVRVGVEPDAAACSWCPGPDTPFARKLNALNELVDGEVNMAAARWHGWPRSGVPWTDYDHLLPLNDPAMFPGGHGGRPSGAHTYHEGDDPHWEVGPLWARRSPDPDRHKPGGWWERIGAIADRMEANNL